MGWLNMWVKFRLKFQAIAEKTAKKNKTRTKYGYVSLLTNGRVTVTRKVVKRYNNIFSYEFL